MSIVFFCMKKLSPQQRRFFSCSPEKKSSNIRTRLYFAKERSLSKDCEGKMAWKTAVSFRISLSILWVTTNFFHGHYLKCIKNFREKFIWLDNILQFPLVLLEKTTASFRDRISVWIRQILGTKWSELDSESVKITFWISFWFSILFSLALKRWNKKIGNYNYINESSSDNRRQLDTHHHFCPEIELTEWIH